MTITNNDEALKRLAELAPQIEALETERASHFSERDSLIVALYEADLKTTTIGRLAGLPPQQVHRLLEKAGAPAKRRHEHYAVRSGETLAGYEAQVARVEQLRDIINPAKIKAKELRAERDELIVGLYDRGLAGATIAEAAGIARPGMYPILKRAGR